MVVWKFPLKVDDYQVIEMPEYGTALAVQIQNGIPCLWMLVDQFERKVRMAVRTFGMGNDAISMDMLYLGSYQLGELVFHVFFDGQI